MPAKTVQFPALLDHGFNGFMWIEHELAVNAKMIGILKRDRLQAKAVYLPQSCIGQGHQDRRVGRHNDLGFSVPLHSPEDLEEVELPGWRKR